MSPDESRFFLPIFQNAFRDWKRKGWSVEVLREKGKIMGFSLVKGNAKITHSTIEKEYRPVTGVPITVRVNGRLEGVTPTSGIDVSVAGQSPNQVIDQINEWLVEVEEKA